jgi:putative flippase GtrA
MNTFIKAQTASLVSTAADFSAVIILIEILHCLVVPAGVIGNVMGAVVNFKMGKNWVFDPSDKKKPGQALIYTVFWFGYLTLSALGMYFMEHFTSLHYIISKVVISLIICFTYNYYTQKNLVFN